MYNFNIEFQAVGLILVILLLILSIGRKNLHLINDRAFGGLLGIVFLSIVFDIISIFTINYDNDGSIPHLLNIAVCKIYIFSLVTVAACVLFYTLSEIYSGSVLSRKYLLVFVLPEAVAVPGVFLTELDYHLDRDAIYSYGLSTDIGSWLVVVYLITSLVYLFIFRESINRRRANSIVVFALSLLCTGLFQNFNRRYLVAGIAMAISMIYVYLTLENPEDYIEHTTGTFNRNAYYKYVRAMSLEKKKFSMIGIHFEGYKFIQDIYGEKILGKLMENVIGYFETFPKAMVFCFGESDYTLIFPKSDHFATDVQRIRKDFTREWHVGDVDVELPASVVAFPSDRMPEEYEITLNIFQHFINEVRHDREIDYVFIDNKELRDKELNDNIERILVEAISNDSIEAYYQPIYDVQTGQIHAVEALARIKDSTGEVLINDDLLPIAEKSGIILKIGMRAFEDVCRFVRDNDIGKLGIGKIGINLSTVQCMQRDMADSLIDIMGKYGIPGSVFSFEIVDDTARYSRDTLLRNMNRLIANGSEFAMDRFGRQYDGIIDMVEMPVKSVKIDRSTIKYCFSGDNNQMHEAGELMLKIIMQMEKQVVAVGVENEGEYSLLKRAGISYMQGAYLSMPLSEEELLKKISGNPLKEEKEIMLQ